MNDLISREVAIKAVDEAWQRWDVTTIDQLRDKLNELLLVIPSEKPEPCEDCVSRKVIMQHYDSGEYKHVNHISRNGLLDYIEQLPSAQPERRWIPCSERLPKEERWYITTIENEKTGRRRIENDLFAIGIAEAHGNTPYKFCKDGYRQKTIAWMPLPEPYQEGES